MRLGNGVDDGKAKPEAVAPAVTRGCQSLERLEEPLDLVAGDNWPAVGDGKVAIAPRVWVVISTCPSGWL